jgi:hypothetical protein
MLMQLMKILKAALAGLLDVGSIQVYNLDWWVRAFSLFNCERADSLFNCERSSLVYPPSIRQHYNTCM